MSALDERPRVGAADASPLAALLGWEGAARRQATVPELLYHIANEARGLIGYDQLFVLARPLAGNGWQVRCVSSLATVDRNAPAVRAIEAAVRRLGADPRDLDAPADPALADYPFHHWLWHPLLDRDGMPFAALLAARARPFDRAEAARLARVAETAQHAWLALTGGKPPRRLPKLTRRQRRVIAAAATAVALFPVHLSALAPVEVVAADPFTVTAPFQGVVAGIDVAPGQRVSAGQTLLRFDDVRLRNELSLATEKLQVARAKAEEVSSLSFNDSSEARGLSIAQAEYRLADAEYRYARDMLAQARVTAPRAGIAIFGDRREWVGRAVEVGQPILKVADPARVRYRIDLPAHEQLRLSPGSTVSVWLDSQPLWSQSATLDEVAYQAKPTADGVLAFALEAVPADGGHPRIGSRGTARVRGGWVPLAYAALKRPIAGARQFLGV